MHQHFFTHNAQVIGKKMREPIFPDHISMEERIVLEMRLWFVILSILMVLLEVI